MRNKQKNIIVPILIVLVIILTTSAFLYKFFNRIKDNPAGTLGNTAGNLQNGGLFCEDDGVVYFSNPYDGGSLYAMNADESNIKKLTTGDIQFINSAGKYLYYYNSCAGTGKGLGYLFDSAGFFRYKKNSSANPVYMKKSQGISLSLIDNYLYYETYSSSNHLSLYKMKIDGTDETKLSDEDINPSCVSSSAFFYSQPDVNMHLQYWDTLSDTNTELLAEDVAKPVIYGNYVYYIDVHNNYGISRADIATGDVTPIIDGRVDCFNIADNVIYYQTSGDEYALKSASIDGSNVALILPGVYHNINVTSQYVYFQEYNAQTPMYKLPLGSTGVSNFDAAQQAVK